MTMTELSPKEHRVLTQVVAPLDGPAYIYFLERLRERHAQLRAVFPDLVSIAYSIKANPHAELLRSLSAGAADVSSLGELERALAAGFAPERLSFVGPGKTNAELAYALEKRCGLIVLESLGEAERLAALAEERGQVIEVLLRVNPTSFTAASGREAQRLPSPFGVDEEQLPVILPRLKALRSLRPRGVHVHAQSHLLNAAAILRNFKGVFDIADQIHREHGWPREIIDLGGGFGIPYFEGQNELDLVELRSGFAELAARARQNGSRLIVESGRFLSGPCGFYVVRVVERKVSRGRTYLILEGGLNHHLAAAGFGQGIRRNFPVAALNPRAGSTLETVTLAGPTCYGMDVLGLDVELPRLAVGDWIYFANSGAYGPSFSPVNFLSHPPPKEICL